MAAFKQAKNQRTRHQHLNARFLKQCRAFSALQLRNQVKAAPWMVLVFLSRQTFVSEATPPFGNTVSTLLHYSGTTWQTSLQTAALKNNKKSQLQSPAPSNVNSADLYFSFSKCSVIAHELSWCIWDNSWSQRRLWEKRRRQSHGLGTVFIVLLSLGP